MKPRRSRYQATTVTDDMAAACAASFSFMIMGMARAWSSPAMPSLIASGQVEMTDEDRSWIVSVPPLCSIFGSLLAGPLLTVLGRKKTLIAIAFPFSLGFLLIGFANHKWMLYVGRILCGTMIGITAPSAQIFIGECSSPRVRGALGSFTAIFLALGIVVTYVIGAFVPWNVLAWILAGSPVLLVAAMVFMPETPAWLLSKGREDEARRSLQWLRGEHTDVAGEFQRLRANTLKSSSSSSSADGHQQRIQPKELLKGSVLKPLLISMVLMLLQQFSGVNSIIYFTVSIFEASGSTLDEKVSTVIVGVVQLVATVVSMFLVDRAGRRLLLLFSGLFMTVSLAAMGSFFYLKELHGEETVATLGWLPLASLLVFIVAYSSGYANVPFLIMGELFPAKYRSLLGSLSSCFNLACTFAVVRSFVPMNNAVGHHVTFWFYMTWCALGLAFVYFFLPETKGKSLEDIERLFAAKSKTQPSTTTSSSTTFTQTLSSLDLTGGAKSDMAVYTIDAASAASAVQSSTSHTNQAYDDSDSDRDDPVVATPL